MTLHTYLPQDRLTALANNTTLPDRTSGSVLFADISGFTALTESLHERLGARQGAEQLSKQLDAVYSALIAEVEKYGGSVIGFAGDAMMCWFDTPMMNVEARMMNKNSSLRAIATAFGMQSAIRDFPTLGLKVAIASGQVRRFVVGDPEIQKIDTLAGTTVTRTAVGEHLAVRGDVLVDGVTANLLGETIKMKEWRQDEESDQQFAVIGDQDLRIEERYVPGAEAQTVTPVLQALRPYLLPEVYERETSGQGTFLTEFRPCVALFLKFTGIEYDSDSAEIELDAFIRTVQATASHHGGALLQLTIGDKGSYAYVNFGALNAHEDDARRAVKTALELRNKTELHLQIGITQGVMRVGGYGGETRKEFGALGDDVNLAARLMTTAKENEILLSSHVHKAVMDQFTFEPRAPLPMKGKAEPLPVFAVTGESQKRAVRLQEPNYALPMVGRQAELKLIEEKLALARAGQSQVFGIVAEAGLGKSRLVAEVIRSARKKGFVGYGGACQSDGIHTPYLAWKSIWQAFFDVDTDMPLRKQIRNIEGEIKDRAPSRIDAIPLLNAVLDLNISDNDFTKYLEPQVRQSALHALLEDCLKAQAQDEPTLIVIEDLHWIDAPSHELLEQLAKALAQYAVCFVLAYRPLQLEHSQSLHIEALEQFTCIELRELNKSEAESAIRAKLVQLYPARGGALPTGLVDTLMARTQGNPFYLEELLNYVRDRGLDPSDLESIDLPDNLHTLILSRIDQLSEQEKITLRVASIVGRSFRAKWLTGYYPELGAFPTVKASLDTLDALDITPLDSPEPELAYLFKHIVTHEVTYESLPFATRARLHEQLARYLEGQIDNGTTQGSFLLETIANHYLRSENTEKQAEYLRKAGEYAQKNCANEAALEYYSQLLPLLQDAKQQTEVHLKRGEVHEFLGKFEEAESDYRIALELAKDNNKLKADALCGSASLAQRRGDKAAAQALYAEAFEILSVMLKNAEDDQDLVEQVRILENMGRTRLNQADHLASLNLAIRCEGLARQANEKSLLARSLRTQGISRLRLGETQASITPTEQALAIFTELNIKEDMARCVNILGAAYYMSGRLDKAEEYMDDALRIFQELGNRPYTMDLMNNLGVMAEARGDYETAFQRFDSALTVAREIGYHAGLVLFLTNRSGVHVALKNFQAAEKDSTQAITMAGVAASWIMPLTFIYHAESLLGQERYEEAIDSARQALALAEEAKEPEYIGMAWRTLGMIGSRIKNTVRISDWETHQEKDIDAEFCFSKSAQVLTDAKTDLEYARTLREWGRHEILLGNKDKGIKLWQGSLELFLKLGVQREAEKMKDLPM